MAPGWKLPAHNSRSPGRRRERRVRVRRSASRAGLTTGSECGRTVPSPIPVRGGTGAGEDWGRRVRGLPHGHGAMSAVKRAPQVHVRAAARPNHRTERLTRRRARESGGCGASGLPARARGSRSAGSAATTSSEVVSVHPLGTGSFSEPVTEPDAEGPGWTRTRPGPLLASRTGSFSSGAGGVRTTERRPEGEARSGGKRDPPRVDPTSRSYPAKMI